MYDAEGNRLCETPRAARTALDSITKAMAVIFAYTRGSAQLAFSAYFFNQPLHNSCLLAFV